MLSQLACVKAFPANRQIVAKHYTFSARPTLFSAYLVKAHNQQCMDLYGSHVYTTTDVTVNVACIGVLEGRGAHPSRQLQPPSGPPGLQQQRPGTQQRQQQHASHDQNPQQPSQQMKLLTRGAPSASGNASAGAEPALAEQTHHASSQSDPGTSVLWLTCCG